jgi:hypothetical protein
MTMNLQACDSFADNGERLVIYMRARVKKL